MLSKEKTLSLSGFVSPACVLFLPIISRDEALHLLVTSLVKEGYVRDQNAFFKAVLEREKIVSTGIGLGIAIPHARCVDCEKFFIAIGVVSEEGMIEVGGLEGEREGEWTSGIAVHNSIASSIARPITSSAATSTRMTLTTGISWDSMDRLPVRLIFLIGGPDRNQTEYLKILSRLTTLIKNEEFRRKLMNARIPADVINLFQGC